MTLSELCVSCGLCCEGSLFRFLPLTEGDVNTCAALALPVVTQSGRQAMPLPCAKLEDRRCGAYELRPAGCRAFVCHLGHRLETRAITAAAAVATVKEAQRRITVLRTVWPTSSPLVQHATQAALDGAPQMQGAALDALEAVHEWLDEHLHWPEA